MLSAMAIRGSSSARLVAVAALAAVVLGGAVAVAGPGDTTLVSRQSKAAGGAAADASSYSPAASASGRFVAFQTEAGNLAGPIHPDADYNIYVYDRRRKRVELVSRQSKRAGWDGADGSSFDPAISGDGRFVAFRTTAGNLGGPIEQQSGNIYVYDRERDRVRLVSRQGRAAGGNGADNNAEDAVISADGRFIAYQTVATNLGGPIQTGVNHYVYDRKRKRTQLVSRQSRAAGGEGQNDSFYDDDGASLSASGRYFAWTTEATNLGGPIPPGGPRSIYVYDRKRKRTQLVSRASASAGGEGAAGGADSPSLSANGRFVAFDIAGNELGGPANAVYNVYVYDRKRRRVQLISRYGKAAGGAGAENGSFDPDISGDGRLVSFTTFGELGGPAEDDVYNIYVYDRVPRRQRLASRKGGAGGDGFSESSAMARSGRLVAFRSAADNLGPNSAGAPYSVYVHELPR